MVNPATSQRGAVFACGATMGKYDRYQFAKVNPETGRFYGEPEPLSDPADDFDYQYEAEEKFAEDYERGWSDQAERARRLAAHGDMMVRATLEARAHFRKFTRRDIGAEKYLRFQQDSGCNKTAAMMRVNNEMGWGWPVETKTQRDTAKRNLERWVKDYLKQS